MPERPLRRACIDSTLVADEADFIDGLQKRTESCSGWKLRHLRSIAASFSEGCAHKHGELEGTLRLLSYPQICASNEEPQGGMTLYLRSSERSWDDSARNRNFSGALLKEGHEVACGA